MKSPILSLRHWPTRLLKRTWIRLALGLLLSASTGLPAAAPNPTDDVLVLYDSAGQFGWVGEMNARFLLNLLGHFPQTYQLMPIEQYVSGDALRFRATFYLGNDYNNTLPDAFLEDVLSTTKPVCWFKYNLWKLGSDPSFGPQFEAKFGFRFEYMDLSGFPQIEYNGETFEKDSLDAELGRTTILDATRATARALARQLPSSNAIPYIVHGSNFWYVADIPFAYISEEDRYLVFADLLHDIIQHDHPQTHQAIIRLEDIDPGYNTLTLKSAGDYLNAEGVPFAVAVIPKYVDPLGIYNQGTPVSLALSQAPELAQSLKYLVSHGGQLVMHGYTHQYGTIPNPYTAVSADDYEFFRVTIDSQTNITTYTPVPEDSSAWAQARVNNGLQEFNATGLNPVAWETPHYAASAIDYLVFATNFSLTIQRVLYSDETGHRAGQFFPYTIQKDVYGQKILPENLGNVNPSGKIRLPADIVRAARKNRVLRDAWASAFYHPYLGLSGLEEIVTGIKALGYTFVPVTDTVRPTITSSPSDQAVTNGARVVLNAQAVGTATLKYQWLFNGTNIARATNTTLTITNAQSGNAGLYAIVVTNAVGTATSPPARLQVVSPFSVSNVSFSATRCSFYIHTEPGVIYTMEYKDDLNDPQWHFFSTLTGDGASIQITDLSGVVKQRFYRVTVH